MLQVFLDNESGEPAGHCGEAGKEETITAIGHFIRADLDDAIANGGRRIDLTIIIKEMTDAEVTALPEM